MRCAIISDIQGNIAALEAVWADIVGRSVEEVYCAGDLTGLGTHPNEVIDFIREGGVATVMGDFDEVIGFDLSAHDHYHPDAALEEAGIEALRWNKRKVGAEQKRFLRALPLQLRQHRAGLDLLVVHGSPRSLSEYVFEDKPEATFVELAKFAGSDLIIFGHTGQAYVKHIADTWFINAGSVGSRSEAEQRATYWLVDLEGKLTFELQSVAYAAPAAEAVVGQPASTQRAWPETVKGRRQQAAGRAAALDRKKGKV